MVAVLDAPAVAEGRFATDPTAIEAQRLADENLDHESPLEELFEDQLACADVVLINKTDLLAEDDLAVARDLLLEELGWDGPVFEVSAATGAGTEALGHAVMQALEEFAEEEEAAAN